MDKETTPLLKPDNLGPSAGRYLRANSVRTLSLSCSIKATGITGNQSEIEGQEVGLRRHIGLASACAVIIGGVTGSGIFITPTGVTKHVGSVGLTLIIWAFGGIFNLLLAICYSELGTAFPVSGGDYTYIHRLLGPMPAFLTLWISVMLMAPGTTAALAKTVSIHIFQMLDLECEVSVVAICSIWIICTSGVLNTVSVRWSARLINFLTICKFIAMATVAIIGIIRLVKGYTSEFEHVFAGSVLTPGAIIGGFLPGHVSFAGWDMINVLAEEMKNPGRDLPLSTMISMSAVTFIYLLINTAYFTALSPAEFAESNAVAQIFAEKTIPQASWIIPVFVSLAALSSVHGMTMVYPRISYAGALDGQLPAVLSYLHIDYLSPIISIIMLVVLSCFIASLTFFDIQALLGMLGVTMILKSIMTLIALVNLKRKMSHIERKVKVPMPLVVFCIILLLTIVGISLYVDPIINGVGLAVFMLGIPIYYLGQMMSRGSKNGHLDNFTVVIQKMLKCVPPIKCD